MADDRQRDISEILADLQVVVDAIREGVLAAIQRHKQMGLPMATWRDGKVAWLSAEELERDFPGRIAESPSPKT